jgi:hypothetical protein
MAQAYFAKQCDCSARRGIVWAVLTLKLGLGKFRSEKWWERKAATYVNVIEAMHDMYAYASAIVDEANADWELSKKHRTTLSDNNLARSLWT